MRILILALVIFVGWGSPEIFASDRSTTSVPMLRVKEVKSGDEMKMPPKGGLKPGLQRQSSQLVVPTVDQQKVTIDGFVTRTNLNVKVMQENTAPSDSMKKLKSDYERKLGEFVAAGFLKKNDKQEYEPTDKCRNQFNPCKRGLGDIMTVYSRWEEAKSKK
jgi:hypothetical protein